MKSRMAWPLLVSSVLVGGLVGYGEASEPVVEKPNPYSPRRGLSPAQLVDFIFDMHDKPRAVQNRPGFNAAVVEAAERLLEGDSSDKQEELAILTKLEFLHCDAEGGDQAADAKLKAFVELLKGDSRKKIAGQVRHYTLEYRALDAERLSADEIRELLGELETFFEETTLTQQHLRIARATVAAIKRLQTWKEREKLFRRFGDMFAKSKNRTLSNYGTSVLKLLEDEAAKNSRPNDYWDVCEAVFRHQFGHNPSAAQQRTKAYYLSVRGTDPPAEFLRRFEKHKPAVKSGSQFRQGAGLRFRVDSFKWTGEDTAEVEGGYYEGNLSASGNTYKVEKTDSGWKVTGRTMSWIS